MRTLGIKLAGALLLASLATAARAADPETAQVLRTVFQANLDATRNRNLKDLLATVHSNSPAFAATAKQMQDFFSKWEVKSAIDEFKYVATDDDYAIARTKFKTVRVSGPPFRDNVIDAYCVFKKEGGGWKIWTQATLHVALLETPAATKPAGQTPPKK